MIDEIFCDVVLIGYAVNSTSGGYTNKNVKYIDTVGIKYLYSHFYTTYCAEPVAFLQIAAELRNSGFSTHILDGLLMGYELNDLKEMLRHIHSKLYCFSMYESSEDDVVNLMRFLKSINPDAVIVTGGPYVTLCYKDIMEKYPYIDYTTIGDGDRVYVKLISSLKKNQKPEKIPNLIRRDDNSCIMDVKPEAVDLNSVHFLERDFANEIQAKNYSFSMVGSRGCGHAACSFCYLPKYQRVGCQPKIRYRDPVLLVNEIKSLIDKYQINKLTFVDEDFFGTNDQGIDHAMQFLSKLVEEKINIKLYINVRVASVLHLIDNCLLDKVAEAGVAYMFVGLESYNDEILKKYNKLISTDNIDKVCDELEKRKIKINPGLITFDPDLTIYQVNRNVSLLRRIDYYDVFMFTRTLMSLPKENTERNNNAEDNSFFQYANTSLLYEKLVLFRDGIYEKFQGLKYDKVTESARNSIISEHFLFYEEVYKLIQEEKYTDNSFNIIYNNHYNKIVQYVLDLSN